jgi:hypothetical protein
MPLDSLDIRISADTANFVAGVERSESKLDGLSSQALRTAGSLEVLSSRAKDAAGQIGRLGKTATASAFGIKTLTSSLPGLNLGLISVSGTMTAVAIPALIALGSALLPLAATVGVVAAALGGIGLGVFAGGAAAAAANTAVLKDAFMEMLAELQAVLEPLADAFFPLLVAIIDRVPEMVAETVALIGGFRDFRDAVWGVADAFFDVMPNILATLFELGEQALPIVERVVRVVGRNFEPALRGLLRVTDRIVMGLIRRVVVWCRCLVTLSLACLRICRRGSRIRRFLRYRILRLCSLGNSQMH